MSRKIFEGIHVLDFGWIGVGPISGKYLADHGADVIRLECLDRPDTLRLGRANKDGIPGINRSQFFAAYNSSKMSLGIDLNTPEGLAITKRLIVEWPIDIIVEGMTPRAMRKWGLEYEGVVKMKPDIIYLSTKQQGQTGPWADFAGHGGTGIAMSGFQHTTGWPDRPPAYPYGAYTDFINPHLNFVTLAAALDYRRRTGKGLYIDNAQVEGGMTFQGHRVLDYTVNGRVANRRGNLSDRAVPHNTYRCLGDDRWVAIAVHSDAEWRAFCKIIGEPAWTKEPKFATFLARKQNEEELDRLIEEWTQNYTPDEVMIMMQADGVPAGTLQACSELHDDPQLKHRGFFVWAEHTAMGPMPYDGLMFTLSKTPGEVRAAPCIGEHSEYILQEILHLSEDEVNDLIVKGVVKWDLSDAPLGAVRY